MSYYVSRSEFPDNPDYDFEVEVPLGFELAAQSNAATASFRNPDLSGIQIEIRLETIDRQLSAHDLLLARLQRKGLRPVNCRHLSGNSGPQLDAVYLDGEGSIVRSIVFRNGATFCSVCISASHSESLTAGGMVRTVLGSFRFLKPASQTSGESLQSFRAESDPSIHFRYPGSWRVVTIPETSANGWHELVSSCRGSVTGRIRVKHHAESNADAAAHVLRQYSDWLKEQGIRLAGAPIVGVSPPSGFQKAALYSPSAWYNESKFDTPVLLLERAGQAVVVGLIGVSREASPEWWAINKRAFEIVRDSFRLTEIATAAPADPVGVPN